MCYPENLAVSVSAIGVALAQGKTADELALMSAVFTQLADTLTTIGAARELCENAQDEQSRKEDSGKEQSQKQEQDKNL